MSSARSNAAARARRAGGDMPPPPQQMNGRPGQQFQQQGQQMQQAGLGAKLSISDAIALITLRLGRVEQIVQNMPVDGQSNLDENSRVVDEVVLANIVQRLEALEKSHKVLADRKPTVTSASTSSPVTNGLVNTQLSETVDVLKAEVTQVKDLLIQLQSFTMQTNQRLSDIVFNGGEFVDQHDSSNEDIVSGNIVDDASAQALLGLQNSIVYDLNTTVNANN
jgi:hypothetical protein